MKTINKDTIKKLVRHKPLLEDEVIGSETRRYIRLHFMLYIITVITLNLILITIYILSRYDIFISDSYKTKLIEISSESRNWHQTDNINIFKTYDKNGEKVIYPGQFGEYSFAISNNGSKPLSYRLEVEEKNEKHINIKYRLKLANVYVSGNENEWNSADNMEIKDVLILCGSTSYYTLEWKWFEDENDDELMKDGLAKYNVYVNVYSSIYDGKIEI